MSLSSPPAVGAARLHLHGDSGSRNSEAAAADSRSDAPESGSPPSASGLLMSVLWS